MESGNRRRGGGRGADIAIDQGQSAHIGHAGGATKGSITRSGPQINGCNNGWDHDRSNGREAPHFVGNHRVSRNVFHAG